MFQLYSPPGTLTSRLLGLNQILFTDCAYPAHFFFSASFKWQQLAYPFVLLALYWFLAIEFSYSKEKNGQGGLLSPPRSPPIPALPSVAVARTLNVRESLKRTLMNLLC
jgi:hypothetical protein